MEVNTKLIFKSIMTILYRDIEKHSHHDDMEVKTYIHQPKCDAVVGHE